jgi:dimethylamine monooxygenase subunit A
LWGGHPEPPIPCLNTQVTFEKACRSIGGIVLYFPLSNGRYEVKPGMMPLGFDLGAGEFDSKVFQIDSHFGEYRQIKLLARQEKLGKYYQTCNFSGKVESAITNLIVTRLTKEYPQYFNFVRLTDNKYKFHSQLTKETLYLNNDLQLLEVEGNKVSPNYSPEDSPGYIDTIDALAVQIQEDLTVICRNDDAKNWLAAVHLCYPNHWSAAEKVGKDFSTIHSPVAEMEKINRRGDGIVNTMISRKPMVRFAWGLSTDTRLNHHPEAPIGMLSDEWEGRCFDPENPQLFLRIERQVIWGLPEVDAALFTIRTYFRDCVEIKQDPVLRSNLCDAINSMTPDSLVYKGLLESKDNILAWLEE